MVIVMKLFEYNVLHLLNKLKEQSECIDKQVACIITNRYGNIISVGVNEIINCDKNCHDKEKRICKTIHAEIEACTNLSALDHTRGGSLTAYLNLFPCVSCQKALAVWVTEIVVFGKQHKDKWFKNIRLEPNLYQDILKHNGNQKQLSVAQGELAELITAISDYFYRPDKKKDLNYITDEILDAEFMLDQIKLITWLKEPETFNRLRELRNHKYDKLIDLLNKNVI